VADDVTDARRRLAARQEALLSALVAGASPPAGVDAERVTVQAEALIAKRRRVAQRAWPELAAALGEGFATAFDEYARATPRRTEATGRARSDAVDFALHLSRRGLLPAGFRAALLRARLRGRRGQRSFGATSARVNSSKEREWP
jgi:hypothetical protein